MHETGYIDTKMTLTAVQGGIVVSVGRAVVRYSDRGRARGRDEQPTHGHVPRSGSRGAGSSLIWPVLLCVRHSVTPLGSRTAAVRSLSRCVATGPVHDRPAPATCCQFCDTHAFAVKLVVWRVQVLWESAAELPRFFPPHWQDVERQQAADTVGSEDLEDDNLPSDFSSTAQVPSPGV